MVQRKYIVDLVSSKSLYKLLGFLLIATSPGIAKSVAWLPDKGHYKLSTSVLFSDELTKKLQNKRAEILLEAYRDMGELLSKDNLTKSEKKDLQELEDFCNTYDAFNDTLFTYQEIEYGIGSEQSFGLKAYLSSERFLQYRYNNKFTDDYIFKKKITKGIGFYYKYLLYKNDRWQIVIMPEISQFGRSNTDEKFAYSAGIYAGYSKTTKSGKNYFSEFGFNISSIFNDSYKDTILNKFSFTEGIELIKGFFIINYVEYSFASNGNMLYKHTIYEQASITKEFKHSANKMSITAQVGYYWKRSLKNKNFWVSGPLFSLYLNI